MFIFIFGYSPSKQGHQLELEATRATPAWRGFFSRARRAKNALPSHKEMRSKSPWRGINSKFCPYGVHPSGNPIMACPALISDHPSCLSMSVPFYLFFAEGKIIQSSLHPKPAFLLACCCLRARVLLLREKRPGRASSAKARRSTNAHPSSPRNQHHDRRVMDVDRAQLARLQLKNSTRKPLLHLQPRRGGQGLGHGYHPSLST